VTDGRGPESALRVGDVLLRDAPVASVEFLVADGVVVLAAGGRRVRFTAVRATTFLAPWDGTPGTVEWLRVVGVDAREICLELRVRWREVPRVYRIVCAAVAIE
jgi:hypothetical protein